MARAAVALVALLGIVASASAARLTWAGCDTNFRNVMNWASNESLPWVAEGETPVTTVYFAHEDGSYYNPVNSFVADGIYSMNELVLPDDGILTLSAEGSEVVFYDLEETSGAAHFIAGQEERMRDDSCNFKCHKPWKLGAGTPSERDTTHPPCDDDIAVFPPESTYRVLAQGVINVKGLEFDGAPIASKADIPEYQITPANTELKMIIDDNQNCFDDGVVKGEACLCHSQCADDDRHRLQDKELREIVKAVAALDLEATHEHSYRTFDASFFVSNIMADLNFGGTGKEEAMCLFATDASAAALKSALKRSIELGLPGASVLDLTVVYNENTNVIYVGSQNVSVSLASVSPVNADGSLGASWWGSPEEIKDAPAGPNMLNYHLWGTILEQAAACKTDAKTAELQALVSECGAKYDFATCSSLRVIAEAAAAGGTSAVIDELIEDMADYVANPPTSFNATNNETTVLPYDNADLSGFTASTDLDAAVQVVLTALEKGADADNVTVVAVSFFDANAAIVAAQVEAAAFPGSLLTPSTYTLAMVVGRLLPQSDLNRLADHRNSKPLARYIADNLSGTPPILSMNALDIFFAIINEQFPSNDPARRRREADSGTSGQAHSPLEIKFAYEMLTNPSCTAGSTANDCPLTLNSGTYHLIHGVLDDLVSLYEIVTAKCYDIDAGNDIACGASEALKIMRANPKLSREEQLALARKQLKEYLDCPSGDCASNEDQEARRNADIDKALSSAQQQASESGATAGVPIPAVAGAAGALLLIALVVLLVVRRRRQGPKPAKAPKAKKSGGIADRTVVAFENPMYDDPADSHTMYDTATLDDGPQDEGLYDEPAFNADKNKENPMYESTENLAGDGAETEEGGYLDVAPEDAEDE